MADTWTDEFLAESIASVQALAYDPGLQAPMVAMAERITAAVRVGNELLVAGNGGSAGDAQHIAGEFLSRLMFDRARLAAIALTTDSSVLTAVGNDYGYAAVFERQVGALGRPGDALLGISTSGRSPNVLSALAAARELGLVTMAFAGAEPAGLSEADWVLAARLAGLESPSRSISRRRTSSARRWSVRCSPTPRADRDGRRAPGRDPLAGGLGSRLGEATAQTLKPVLPCGDQPFLAWLICELVRFGIDEILLLAGHLSSVLEASLPAIVRTLPRPVTIAVEPMRAGTGGALFHARDRLRDRFLLCSGDSLMNFNLARLLAAGDATGDRMVLRAVARHRPILSEVVVAVTTGKQ